MRVLKASVLVCGFGVGLLAACGEDKEDVSSGAAAGGTQAGSGGSPSAGGTGGASASGGTGGSQMATGGTGGAAQLPAPVQCAANSCQGYLLAGQLPVAPCCVPRSNVCGVDLGQLAGAGSACIAVNQPGTRDASCPDYNLQMLAPEAPLPLPFPGCCTPSGACGAEIDLTLFGGPKLGCLDPVGLGLTPSTQACGNGAGGGAGAGAGGTGAAGAPASGGSGGAVAGAPGSD